MVHVTPQDIFPSLLKLLKIFLKASIKHAKLDNMILLKYWYSLKYVYINKIIRPTRQHYPVSTSKMKGKQHYIFSGPQVLPPTPGREVWSV